MRRLGEDIPAETEAEFVAVQGRPADLRARAVGAGKKGIDQICIRLVDPPRRVAALRDPDGRGQGTLPPQVHDPHEVDRRRDTLSYAFVVSFPGKTWTRVHIRLQCAAGHRLVGLSAAPESTSIASLGPRDRSAPLSLCGPALNVRKFAPVPFLPEQLVRRGTLGPRALAFLAACVRGHANIFGNGGTLDVGSGTDCRR
jgi:hypothetical protein